MRRKGKKGPRGTSKFQLSGRQSPPPVQSLAGETQKVQSAAAYSSAAFRCRHSPTRAFSRGSYARRDDGSPGGARARATALLGPRERGGGDAADQRGASGARAEKRAGCVLGFGRGFGCGDGRRRGRRRTAFGRRIRGRKRGAAVSHGVLSGAGVRAEAARPGAGLRSIRRQARFRPRAHRRLLGDPAGVAPRRAETAEDVAGSHHAGHKGLGGEGYPHGPAVRGRRARPRDGRAARRGGDGPKGGGGFRRGCGRGGFRARQVQGVPRRVRERGDCRDRRRARRRRGHWRGRGRHRGPRARPVARGLDRRACRRRDSGIDRARRAAVASAPAGAARALRRAASRDAGGDGDRGERLSSRRRHQKIGV